MHGGLLHPPLSPPWRCPTAVASFSPLVTRRASRVLDGNQHLTPHRPRWWGYGAGHPSLFFSSASEQEESAGGWGAGVEGEGADAVGEAVSVAVPGGRDHDRSAVDGDGDELRSTGSGDIKLAHLCDFFLSFFSFFLGFSMRISVRIDSFFT